jgi:hypothetical protein
MFTRMIRAARLDVDFYEMVEANPAYNREAFFVVLTTAVLSGIGMALGYPDEGIGRLIGGVIGTLLAWIAWAGITLWIGTTITRGPGTQSDLAEMLRVLGYAHAPQALIVLVFVPILGPGLALVASVWSLVAGVIAVRQALDFTTTRALLTVGFGWVLLGILRMVLSFLL